MRDIQQRPQIEESRAAEGLRLSDLAARCEAATGPDRELDILIGYAADLRGDDEHLSFRSSFDTCGMGMMLRMAESHHNIWLHELPRYTSSLDAALTLVLEGFAVSVEWSPRYPGSAWLYSPDNINDISFEAEAFSPALALCAAALRARAAMNEHSVAESSSDRDPSLRESSLNKSPSP